jgi:hypothetical protein
VADEEEEVEENGWGPRPEKNRIGCRGAVGRVGMLSLRSRARDRSPTSLFLYMRVSPLLFLYAPLSRWIYLDEERFRDPEYNRASSTSVASQSQRILPWIPRAVHVMGSFRYLYIVPFLFSFFDPRRRYFARVHAGI